MTSLIDVSMSLDEATPAWPGSPGASVRPLKSTEAGDEANVSELTMDVHTGTHLDAPLHMIPGAGSMDDYPLAIGLGEATVVDTGEARAIDADALSGRDLPDGDLTRILLRTVNSRRPELQREFSDDYAGLTVSGAKWLVERGVGLIGIDYLSIQRFDEPTETHLVLLRAGVAILEGLRLETVAPGRYELICLPLRLTASEAAPARAVLRKLDG